MSKRSDAHRPGAIVPSDYEHVLDYALATTIHDEPQPAWGINCEIEHRTTTGGIKVTNGQHAPDGRCCIIGLRQIAKVRWAGSEHGGTGGCSVCGTRFVYGEVWKHIPTGEHIHVGHICASKYGLLADHTDLEAWRAKQGEARATAIQRRLYAEEREAFLAEHPELAEAFAVGDAHLEAKRAGGEEFQNGEAILADLQYKFNRFRSLSENQIRLAVKLADEIKNPPPPEQYVPAPEGRVEFEGRIVSVKDRPGYAYNSIEWKATIKVETPDGIWLAWTTVPEALWDACRVVKPTPKGGYSALLRGQTVKLRATLSRGRDAHFAFAKRPHVIEAPDFEVERRQALQADFEADVDYFLEKLHEDFRLAGIPPSTLLDPIKHSFSIGRALASRAAEYQRELAAGE